MSGIGNALDYQRRAAVGIEKLVNLLSTTSAETPEMVTNQV